MGKVVVEFTDRELDLITASVRAELAALQRKQFELEEGEARINATKSSLRPWRGSRYRQEELKRIIVELETGKSRDSSNVAR